MSAPQKKNAFDTEIIDLVSEYFRAADSKITCTQDSVGQEAVDLHGLRKREMVLRSRMKDCA